MIPLLIIVGATVFFFAAERLLPGRELPEVPGWYLRAPRFSMPASSPAYSSPAGLGTTGCRSTPYSMPLIFSRRSFKASPDGSSALSFSTGGIVLVTNPIFCGASFIRFITAPLASSY